MNFKELKELIEIVSATESIEELEVERAGVRLRVRKSVGQPAVQASPSSPDAEAQGSISASAESSAGADSSVSYVTSPMVGTFYRASSPDAEPFVKVGDFVEAGTVVCIVEAMKLMNEIESDITGEVVGIPVENGHPVQYGERLFAIRPR